jgi:hypothetical protein
MADIAASLDKTPKPPKHLFNRWKPQAEKGK